MDQLNLNKVNHDRRNTQQSQYPESTVTDGVRNRFGFKCVLNQEVNKENKQPFAQKPISKLPRKKNGSKKPTFKVGIPHHKFWSPTAKDTPLSHFHGFSKRLKSRKILKSLNRTTDTDNIDQKQPVACTNENDLEQEETTEEIVKEENLMDKLEKEETIIIKNDSLHLDTVGSDDSPRPIKLFHIVMIIILLHIIFFLIGCYFF